MVQDVSRITAMEERRTMKISSLLEGGPMKTMKTIVTGITGMEMFNKILDHDEVCC